MLEHDQDLHVSLKPESANTTLKQGRDIRKMFNKVDSGSKRPSLKAGDFVSGQEEALPYQEVLHGPHQLDDLDGETVWPAVCL